MTSAMGVEWATWPGEWRTIDAALRRNARARAGIDAEEMELLREAERIQIWRPLGMVSMIDYMDRVLGYPPETARKRLRAARALGDLPVLSEALASGALTFSAVREIARVATRETENEWCDAAVEKSSREIEELVGGHRPGDRPEDPRDDSATTHVIRLEVSGATYARLRQARIELADERGESLDDDAFVAMLCDGAAPPSVEGRARAQIALTVCERCERGWQTGGGRAIAVDAATVERARCDAQHIGSLDADALARAHHDIPPATACLVWARDGAHCQTPGCRSARGLELHHVVHRSAGGSHDASNLTLRCGACHRAHDDGLITIAGTAPDALTITRNVAPRPLDRDDGAALCAAHQSSPPSGAGETRPPVSAEPAHHRPTASAALATRSDRFEQAVLRTQARDALVGLGWRSGVATSAVDDAMGHVARGAPVEALIREALRRCPRPTSV